MSSHSENCRECKRAISGLLCKIYGEVKEQFALDLRARIDDLRNASCYDSLARIYDKLSSFRGHDSFVKSVRLPRVDYYVPSRRMVIEFDESQHFTRPRLISLESYPPDLALGFDRLRWMDLAKTLDRRDPNPIYRDEQRAWYDTLRDFSSVLMDNAPTKRIYARDHVWCLLDPNKEPDVQYFKQSFLSE